VELLRITVYTRVSQDNVSEISETVVSVN
jgi:hypothetical protein